MEIKEIAVGLLRPYENNPRDNSEAVEKVAASIREFGFKVPLIIDRENVVVAGHTRLEAAKILGFESVPCVVANDLSPNQLKALRVVDNKVAELSGWDYEKLAKELESIEKDIPMAEFGFSDLGFEDVSSCFDDLSEPEKEEKEKKKCVCPYCGAEQ